jgi:hypothetical protein
MNQTYYIEYTEVGSADYEVRYKENSFFEDEWIGAGNSYVTSLIDEIRADFTYSMDMEANDVGFDYEYDITAQLIISDMDTGDHIFAPKQELIQKTTKAIDRTDGFSIRDIVSIDFREYNSLAHTFITAYGLRNASSMLAVSMNVKVLSRCESFENTNQNTYAITVNIPLLEDNFSINTSSSVTDGENKVLACVGAVNQKVFMIIGIVSAILAAICAGVLVAFIYLTRNEDINYTIKVQKLVRAYRSFIQEIDGEFDTEGYQIVPIKTFVEMLGIRDTIQSPVLMWENRDKTMTQFLIPINTEMLYTFEIKVDNYDDIYAPYSNVYEVEDDNGVEEALIIEEGIALEDVAEALATPDVILSDVEYVEDNDVDYEGDAEHPGVEVVGVVWPERAHKNKVYRYDPNGEKLDVGDMVLVPTRDAAQDREVIRKAAIAHENHVIDPALHPHALKKIIGVIKRRAQESLANEDSDQQ